MPDDFDPFMNQLFSRSVRMADQVGFSLTMLSKTTLRSESRDAFICNAAKELFLVHARLLCEFLLIKPTNIRRDFSVKDFYSSEVPDWPGPSSEDKVILRPLWDFASQVVVHFSLERVPETLESLSPMDTSRENFEFLASKIFDLTHTFLIFQVDSNTRELETLRLHLNEARRILEEGAERAP